MKHIKKVKLIVLLITVSCCLLGIGYASIANINLSLTGIAQLDKQTGIVISSAVIDNYSGVNPDLSEINTYYKTMLDSKVVLGSDPNSYITYQVTLSNLSDKPKKFTGVVIDSDFYDNSDITYEITGLNVDDTVAAGATKTFDLTFKYDDQQSTPINKILNSVIKFDFSNTYDYGFDSSCVFNGQGNDIVGECAGGQHIDYIDTGYKLFSPNNHMNDFEINFTIGEVDPSRFSRTGKFDTIFSCISETDPYPGIVFRIQNDKWFFQAGNGLSGNGNKVQITFDKDAVQSFRVVRQNGIIYYSVNGGSLIQTVDVSNMSSYFTIPLTIGTGLNSSGNPWDIRYFVGTLSSFSLNFADADYIPTSYADADQLIENFIGSPLQVAYNSTGAHTFDGNNANVIDTGVELLNSTNYQKDFVVTLTIDSLNLSSQTNQATLVNIKNEALADVWPGIALRVNSSKKLELTYRDGNGINKTITLDNSTERVNIIKKGNTLYYQTDLGGIELLGDFSQFNLPFNVPVTFGCNINANGNYDRKIVGTLSGMSIKMTS